MQTTDKKKKISFFIWIFLAINVFAVALLLTTYLSAFINPARFSWIAFAGLSYPVILVINFAFMFFWLFVRVKFALLSLITILIGWNHLSGLIQFHRNSDVPGGKRQFRILSYNIQNFLNQNISDTKYINDFKNQVEITKFIIDQKADIICLQEMLYDRGDHRDFAVEFGKKCKTPNFYYRNYFQSKKKKLDAIAIFTKFPIIHNGFLEHEKKTIGIFSDLAIGSDTVRLYNLHLASIHFVQEDYDFIADIQSPDDQNEIAEGSLKVISKIRLAFIQRGEQVEILKKHLNKCPYKYIICGDFNDTPSSFVYREISSEMKDAFRESGRGTCSTYAGESFPAIRIDYILYDRSFTGYHFKRQKNSLSDHYPISCTLIPTEN